MHEIVIWALKLFSINDLSFKSLCNGKFPFEVSLDVAYNFADALGNTFLLRILKPDSLNATALQWPMAPKRTKIGGCGAPYNAVLGAIFLRIFLLHLNYLEASPSSSSHRKSG